MDAKSKVCQLGAGTLLAPSDLKSLSGLGFSYFPHLSKVETQKKSAWFGPDTEPWRLECPMR